MAVIVHHGTAGGGHYTCYALNEPSSQWIEFDDSSVRPVSAETVASCQAYVLFYRKRTTNELDDFRRHINNLAQQELDAQSSESITILFKIISHCLLLFFPNQMVASCSFTSLASGIASFGLLPSRDLSIIRISYALTEEFNHWKSIMSMKLALQLVQLFGKPYIPGILINYIFLESQN